MSVPQMQTNISRWCEEAKLQYHDLSLDGFFGFYCFLLQLREKASNYSGIWNRSVCESSLFSPQTAPK